MVTLLRRSVARIVLCQAELLHRWRISGPGLELLTGEGGALLVYHHGAVPADYIYTIAWLYLHTGRLVHSVVHRHLLLIPGLQTIAEVMSCSAPSREECVELVLAGRLVGVAPGGAGQAMLGLLALEHRSSSSAKKWTNAQNRKQSRKSQLPNSWGLRHQRNTENPFPAHPLL